MFVRPFDRAVVDIVPHNRRLHICLGQHQPPEADAILGIVTLKPVVAFDHMAAAVHDGEMRETVKAAVADLGVVVVDVQRDGRAVLGQNAHLIRQELTAVDQHALTSRADRGDAAILGTGEIAIAKTVHVAGLGQHDTTGISL